MDASKESKRSKEFSGFAGFAVGLEIGLAARGLVTSCDPSEASDPEDNLEFVRRVVGFLVSGGGAIAGTAGGRFSSVAGLEVVGEVFVSGLGVSLGDVVKNKSKSAVAGFAG